MVVTLIEWEHNIRLAGSNHTKRTGKSMKSIWVYCELCKAKYCLAYPCIHHLSDSEEDRARYDAYKRKQKAEKSKGINKQTKLEGHD